MPELCFNLWYYLDKDQRITAIAAREYFLDGTDEEKSQILAELSNHDYKIVKTRPLPEALRRQFGSSLHHSLMRQLGVEGLYKEIFIEIRKSLPNQVEFPDDKLFFATPLFDFENGFVPAKIGDGFITERP